MAMDDDQLESLVSCRPTAATIDAEWSPEYRAQVLASIMADQPALRSPRRIVTRRWSMVAAAVSVAAAVVVGTALIPAGSAGGPDLAAAATLERLAVTAAGGPLLGPHQFDHVLMRTMQDGSQPDANGRWAREQWTAGDTGDTWYRTTDDHALQCAHYSMADPPDFASPTPAFLASLPSDPARLREYVRAHIVGSMSRDEAVFVAIGDMLGSGLPSPELRAEAFRALIGSGHIDVRADTRDALGRPAVRVSFVDAVGRPAEVQSMYFDPSTSRVMQQTDVVDRHTVSLAVITQTGIVGSVPAAVRSCPQLPAR